MKNADISSCFPFKVITVNCYSAVLSFIHSFLAICKAHYVQNVESQALEAVARWSVFGKIVSFQVALEDVE